MISLEIELKIIARVSAYSRTSFRDKLAPKGTQVATEFLNAVEGSNYKN